MAFVFNIIIFITLVLAIVLVTRNLMIISIRKIAIYLRWNNNVIGKLLGYATSTPELISAIVTSSIGMMSACIFNVLSSNIVNIVFVFFVSLKFKRFKSLKHKKFKLDYIFVVITLIVPLLLIFTKFAENIFSIPILVLIYLAYIFLSKSNNYFEEEELKIYGEEVKITEYKLKKKHLNLSRKKKVIFNILILIFSLFLLYFLGNYLGNILEKLGNNFNMPRIYNRNNNGNYNINT
ncbi:MAG: sodium/calcium exchanger protein [Clostridia bacterium]